jgi:hypothetical protein
MEEIEKLILEKHPLIAKYYRERINKVQEVYSYGEELLPELKASIIDGGLFNSKSIQHPLVIGDLGMMPNSDYNKQLIRKQERLKEFENDKNFECYLFLIEKPFRVTSFSELVKQNKIKRLSKKYWKILSFLWTDSENIFQNKELWDDLLKDKTNSHFFMSKNDLNFFNSLENEFMVYRGYTHWENGYSYSLDKDRAVFFANRFGQNGKVKEMLVKKEDVFAYTNSREENEIIILK